MMEKLAQAVEGGGDARPPTFTIVTITYKVVLCAQAERADILTLFHLYPMFSVGLSRGLLRSLTPVWREIIVAFFKVVVY